MYMYDDAAKTITVQYHHQNTEARRSNARYAVIRVVSGEVQMYKKA